MQTFQYKATDATGQIMEGELTAADKKQALQQLTARKLQPIRLSHPETSKSKLPKKNKPSTPSESPPKPKAKVFNLQLHTFHSKISFSAKLAYPFLENLLQLHSSGLPVADAIQLMHKRLQNPKLKELAGRIRSELLAGRSLGDAMRQFTSVFSLNAIHLIEAGEATGNLKPILSNCLEHMESSKEVTQQIRSGLSYPVFVCLMALGIGLFTITNLIPKLQDLTAQMGGEPNGLTRFMIGLSDFAVFQLPLIVVIGLVGVFGLYRWRQSAKGKLRTDDWMLRLPFFGKIIQDIELTRSLSTLQLLLQNGINSVEAMRLCAYAVANEKLRQHFLEARTRIQDGTSFARAFERSEILPQNDLDLVSIGESTGSLVPTLKRIAEMHKEQLSKRFHQLTVAISSLALGLAVSLVALLILSIVISLQDVSRSILAG